MRTLSLTLSFGLVAVLARAQAPAVDADGEAAMLERINALRTENGVAPLVRHPGLDAAARAHSVDMAAHRELVHVSARTGDPARRVQEAGVRTTRVAENIARHGNTLGAHDAILGSDAHRSQLLDPTFTHIGLAAVSGSDGMYITQVLATLAAPPAAELPPPSVAEVEDASSQPEPVQAPSDAARPATPSTPTSEAAAPARSASGDAANQAAANQAAANQAAANQAGRAPTMRMPRAHRRVAGYWIQQGGRWWYFPVPPGARPGQVLSPDPSVQGPPPGYRPQSARRPLVRPTQPPPPVRYRTRPASPRTTIYWY